MNSDEYAISEDLKSRYKNVQFIGSGMMGRVFKAHDKVLLTDVAIKVLAPEKELSTEAAVRFQMEAKTASKLKHRNILSVRDFGISKSGQPFLVMEFAHGRTLDSIISSRGVLSLDETMNVIEQVCDGMQHAHSRQVIHRDLKPANIMVLGDDLVKATVKILDFGIAKLETNALVQSTTPQGSLVGTPHYMSPEQAGSEPVDARTDVYAVGCMMFRMLSGKYPFEAESLMEVLQAKRESDAPRLNTIPGVTPVPVAVQEVVARCLQRHPEDRYASMDELKSALNAAVRDTALFTESSSDSCAPPLTRLVKSGVMVVLLIAGAFLGGFLCMQSDKQTAPDLKTMQAPIVVKGDALTVPVSVEDSFKLSSDRRRWEASATAVNDKVLAQLKNRSIVELKLAYQTGITARGCAFLRYISGLEYLAMDDCALNDACMSQIAKCSNVRRLSIEENPEITNAGVKAIEQMRLKDLRLSGTGISDEAMISIARIAPERLEICQTDVTDKGVRAISSLSSLDCLRMKDLRITDEGCASLPRSITSLDLESTSVSVKGLKNLRGMKLKKLYLMTCSNIDDECVSFIARTWPDLTYLNLNGDTKITGASVPAIASLKKLTMIGLGGINLSDEDVEPLTRLEELRNIDVGGKRITDVSLKRFLGMNLHKISLVGCENLSRDLLSQLEARDVRVCELQGAMRQPGAVESFTDLMH